ncbi:MAG: addiction module toxin RelE [Candidatus Micrarchaeota archaeon]
MFKYDFSQVLKLKIKKLAKKDKKKAKIIKKKTDEIINSPPEAIKHYKNLRHDLSNLKRVHIDKHFVLTFEVNLEKNFILFADFDHHDRIYKIKK